MPSATLIEAAPDLVGLTDIADIVGMSRQNMRKLMLAHPASFPPPVHEGASSLWRLWEVLALSGVWQFKQQRLRKPTFFAVVAIAAAIHHGKR